MSRDMAYVTGMKQERATLPPTAEEKAALEAFEKSEQARSKSATFWAHVVGTAALLGLKVAP